MANVDHGSSEKHTPGPWKVIRSPHGPKYKCVQYGADDSYTSLEMLPSDARLTAAAPDMLAALKQVVDDLQEAKSMAFEAGKIGDYHPQELAPETLTKIMAAITKARGKL